MLPRLHVGTHQVPPEQEINQGGEKHRDHVQTVAVDVQEPRDPPQRQHNGVSLTIPRGSGVNFARGRDADAGVMSSTNGGRSNSHMRGREGPR